MCHGMFDIVHPGHLRHLMYAKEKADLLIASLTADEHITKAALRPYVPQELRAANLAALEMVDFVIVDPNPTPIEHMQVLQPDFFAKGYEYFADGVPPKTQEEIDTLASYGGEMVFTPGDIVYSSSALIEASPPNLGIEKLLALMDSEGIGFDRPARDPRPDARACGCTSSATRSWTPTRTARCWAPPRSRRPSASSTTSARSFAGGAAVVAKHVKAAGAEVTFTTVLGDDAPRTSCWRTWTRPGSWCTAFIDRTRPTTHKERFIADGYKMLQVDRVDNRASRTGRCATSASRWRTADRTS